MDKPKVIETLNRLLELEFAGVIRYTQYSFMMNSPQRLPIVSWLRAQAKESLSHAERVGEQLAGLSEHFTLKIGHLLESHAHSLSDILMEGLEHQRIQLRLYDELYQQIRGKHVTLEEFARRMILDEENHIAAVEKMLKHAI